MPRLVARTPPGVRRVALFPGSGSCLHRSVVPTSGGSERLRGSAEPHIVPCSACSGR